MFLSLLVACIIWAILLLTTRPAALLSADKRQKEALNRLKEKNRREEVAINKAPPAGKLKKNKKLRASAGNRSAAVLKPQQSTPARRPSNDTVAPLDNVVTPCRTSDASTDADATVIEEGEVNRNLEGSGLNLDISDDLSVLSNPSAIDEEDLTMPSTSTKKGGTTTTKKLTAKELETKLASMNIEVANLKNELKSKDEEITALTASHNSKIGAMTREVKEIRHQVTVLCSNTPNSDLLKSYATKVGSLEQEIADLKETHRKEVVEAYKKNGALSTDNSKLRGENNKLLKELSGLKESSDSVEGPQNQRLQAKITDLEAKLKRLQTQGKGKSSSKTSDDSSKKELQKCQAELKACKDANAKLLESNGKLKKHVATQKASSNSSAGEDLKKALQSNEDLECTNKALLGRIDELQKALKGQGKFVKSEVSNKVEKKINGWVKDIGYHKKKFLLTADDTENFLKSIYDDLKDDPELGWSNKDDKDAYKPFSEFQRVYDASVRGALSDRRQYTQTQCLQSIVGTYCS